MRLLSPDTNSYFATWLTFHNRTLTCFLSATVFWCLILVFYLSASKLSASCFAGNLVRDAHAQFVPRELCCFYLRLSKASACDVKICPLFFSLQPPQDRKSG